MSNYKISVLIGSLREESFNRQVAEELISLAPESLEMEIVEIGDLGLYNQDLDENPPEEWTRFRGDIESSNGVLFVTPEYNRSIPGVLKNAIDIGSRPYGASAWEGKAGAVVSVTPGGLGAFGANHVLRKSMVFLNVPMMQQPEAYISNIADLLDEDGSLPDDTRDFLQQFIDTYAVWVEKHS